MIIGDRMAIAGQQPTSTDSLVPKSSPGATQKNDDAPVMEIMMALQRSREEARTDSSSLALSAFDSRAQREQLVAFLEGSHAPLQAPNDDRRWHRGRRVPIEAPGEGKEALEDYLRGVKREGSVPIIGLPIATLEKRRAKMSTQAPNEDGAQELQKWLSENAGKSGATPSDKQSPSQ